MASRTSQRSVYLVTAVIVASMVAGFAIASISLNGSVNTSYQGSQTTLVTYVPGLTWVATNLTVVPSPPAYGSSPTACTSASPTTICDVSSTGYTVCVGGFPGSVACNPSDFVEQVNLSISLVDAFPTLPVALTIYVTGTPIGGAPGTYVGATQYFTEGLVTATLPTTAESILIDYDIGAAATGPGAVSVITVVATASTTT